MDFIMDINEQILPVFEGAMGVHCDREKREKMPFRFFKKNIELILNSFSNTINNSLPRLEAKIYTNKHHIMIHLRAMEPGDIDAI